MQSTEKQGKGIQYNIPYQSRNNCKESINNITIKALKNNKSNTYKNYSSKNDIFPTYTFNLKKMPLMINISLMA